MEYLGVRGLFFRVILLLESLALVSFIVCSILHIGLALENMRCRNPNAGLVVLWVACLYGDWFINRQINGLDSDGVSAIINYDIPGKGNTMPTAGALWWG